jgi:hypothetical protein
LRGQRAIYSILLYTRYQYFYIFLLFSWKRFLSFSGKNMIGFSIQSGVFETPGSEYREQEDFHTTLAGPLPADTSHFFPHQGDCSWQT